MLKKTDERITRFFSLFCYHLSSHLLPSPFFSFLVPSRNSDPGSQSVVGFRVFPSSPQQFLPCIFEPLLPSSTRIAKKKNTKLVSAHLPRYQVRDVAVAVDFSCHTGRTTKRDMTPPHCKAHQSPPSPQTKHATISPHPILRRRSSNHRTTVVVGTPHPNDTWPAGERLNDSATQRYCF